MDYRFTHKSQEALVSAKQRAADQGHPQIEPAHLLVALLTQTDGIAVPLLEAVGTDPAALRRQAEEQLAGLPRVAGADVSPPQMARQLLAVINTASRRAEQLEDEYVSTEHLLVGL